MQRTKQYCRAFTKMFNAWADAPLGEETDDRGAELFIAAMLHFHAGHPQPNMGFNWGVWFSHWLYRARLLSLEELDQITTGV